MLKQTLFAVALSPLFFVSCGDSQASVAGTYSLDTDAMVKAAEAAMSENQGKAEEAPLGGMANKAAEMAVNMLKSMKGEMTLNADGTLSGTIEGMGNKSTVKGNWVLEGDKITLNMTEKDGEPASETTVAKIVDGDIVYSENAGGKEMEFRFKRK